MLSYSLVVLSTLVLRSNGFVVSPYSSLAARECTTTDYFLTQLNAKKRRRRKEASSDREVTDGSTDELPDFDLIEEVQGEPLDVKTAPQAEMSPPPLTSSPDDLTPAMMSSTKPAKTVKDLLNDRSLEKQMRFDEPVDGEELPDLSSFAKRKSGTVTDDLYPESPGGGLGKKAKREARVAAAIARQEEQKQEEDNILKKLQDFGEDITPLKLIENATWLGIGLLVAWEVYLNSPFFERAAPMAPVIYDNLP